jgi:AraC family transcriptional regulator
MSKDSVCNFPSPEAQLEFRREYAARIHRAQDYIEQHLGLPLSLESVAQAAHFSPFHFHRLYSALCGETLFQFVQRVRLERAASRLLQNRHEPITSIAMDLGFSSSATFARAFRNHFGISASAYRANPALMDSKISKPIDKNGKATESGEIYSARVDFDINPWRNLMKFIKPRSIEVKQLPAKTLAYVRHVGPYAGDEGLFSSLSSKVMAWAGPRKLFQPESTEFISMYHDDPAITDAEKLRISVGITVPSDTKGSGEISLMDMPAGPYVCALFEIDVTEYGAAWNTVCGQWMPQSGWQPSDAPCYEVNLNDPKQHPEGKHLVEIRMGVKPL